MKGMDEYQIDTAALARQMDKASSLDRSILQGYFLWHGAAVALWCPHTLTMTFCWEHRN